MLRALVGGLLVGLTLNVGMGLAAAGAQDNATDALTARLMALHVQSQSGDMTTQARVIAEMVRVASARQARLAQIIADHPEQVLAEALPARARAGLAAAVQGYIEKEESIEGELEVWHVDRRDGGSQYLHFLKHGTERISLHFAAGIPELQTGDRVRVSGLRVQQAMAVGSGQSQVLLMTLAIPNTFGAQQTAVLLVTFMDKTTPIASPATVRSATFDAALATSVTNFFKEASYGQAWLVGDVYGPYVIPMMSMASCDPTGIASYARAAAQNAGVSLAGYQRLVFAFPANTCASQFWGLSTVGGNPSQSWITSSYNPGVLSHELGHGFGLWHSHSMDCGAASISASCTTSEYGDTFDTMGNATANNHFNAIQKELLGWLNYGNSPPITTVESSGVYTLDPYESPGANPKALKVKKPSGDYYYVEYRQPIGFDAPSIANNANVKSGLLVHSWVGQSGNGIYLLDMTPSTDSWSDPALDVGGTFTDTASGIGIGPVWANGTAGVNVTVSGSGSSCARRSPTMAVTPPDQQGPAGAALSYTVSVTNNDSGCPASTFSHQVAVPSGWTATFAATTLNLAPGATASTTMQITSTTSAPGGVYTISPTTSNTAATSYSASAMAKYDVTNPTTGNGASFTDGFNRPEASVLANGWSQVAGSLGIQFEEARNGATRMMHTAVQPKLVGAAQTIAMSFASVDNNLGPRFGLLARYKDAKNYYACYRQTGGSSVVRISKVVNGLETVLKQIGISNPQRNVLFTLGCSVQGTTLTLLYGTTKLTATDSTFASGSVGMTMGYPTASRGPAVSHRGDNFSATVQ
jgi:alpha-galactosidase-like protein